jgi:putative addiction module component (TIGR02574 family)
MPALKIDDMSAREKLQAIELIWASLCKTESDIPSPAWHRRELSARLERYRCGEESCADWEKAKQQLRGAKK